MRLDEFTKDEWFSVARVLKPGLSREEYEKMWADFVKEKAAHEKKKSLQ